MTLSVIIPTLHRPEPLMRQLHSLQRQTLASFELLVVDNAADGHLRCRLAAFNSTAPHPVRYFPEPHLGLMQARHTGARHATADVLVYLDDDQTSRPGALQAYAEAFAAHPEMAAAGGPVMLAYDEPPPSWLHRYVAWQLAATGMCPVLSALDLGPDFRLTRRGIFFGGNMAIRRDVLFQVGGFHPELVGSTCVGDGEVGLYQALWAHALCIGYVPEALQVHHIPPERMTVAYVCRRSALDGPSDMYALYRGTRPTRGALLRQAADIVLASLPTWGKALLGRHQTLPWALDAQLVAARTQAQVRYLWRLCWEEDLRAMVAVERWLDAGSTPDPPCLHLGDEHESQRMGGIQRGS
jgi:glucosyl-dolichyl phosphate glucuronosyltransferase